MNAYKLEAWKVNVFILDVPRASFLHALHVVLRWQNPLIDRTIKGIRLHK